MAIMKLVLSGLFVGLAALMTVPLALGQTDRPGSKDYPGMSRMPGYYISEYSESQFDSYSFKVKEGDKEKQQPVEGRRCNYQYRLQQSAVPASALQIVRNFQNAARSAGGQVMRESGEGNDRETTLHLVKGASEVWIAVHAISGVDKIYWLVIVEKQAMQQDVTLDASAMAKDIGETGRVAVYGIHFDTGKSELKPDSAPALAEIAKLLKNKPDLKVYVVGHTDMVADLGTNVALSQARAQAVVKALVGQQGIAAARLIAFGDGPYAPVASNKTEDGRARNRRVELVEIATK
jgi:outer membrane protein OmpA-like peptidoglycan-associated protein